MQQMIPGSMQVLLNSIDVSSAVMTYTIDIPASDIRTVSIVFTKEIDGITTLSTGDVIEIYEGAYGATLTREFYGIIVQKNYDLSGYSVNASDELWKASGRTLTKLYDNSDPADPFGGDIRLIMIDLVSNAKLTTDDSHVDETSVIIPQVLCDSVKIQEKINELARILYWDVYQDPSDRMINFRNPDIYALYPINLQVGDNVVESPDYSENIFQTINEVEIQGIRTFPLTKEQFTGNGSTKTYTVAKYPIATYIKITNSSTSAVLSGAVEGTAGSYDYLVNLNKGIITFSAAPTGGQIYVVEYTATELTTVIVDDAESKAMTKGVRKLVLNITDASTVDDVTQRANGILDQSKESFSNFTIKAINVPGISPRYKLNFVDPLKNKTFANLMIVKVKKSWPEFTTEITVGKSQMILNNLIMTMEERIKKLERVRREGIVLRVNKTFANDFYMTYDDLEITKSVAGEAFILGDSIRGVIGTGKLGYQAGPSTDVEEIITKRRYKWMNATELAQGTYDPNIIISNDKIELG